MYNARALENDAAHLKWTDYSNMAIKNILVIKLRYLGDVLMTTPVFTALKHNFPEAYITAVVNKGTEAMLEQNPAVDRIVTLERMRNPVAETLHYLKLVSELRRLQPDLALELTDSDRGALLSFMSGAKRRLGFKTRKVKWRLRDLLHTDLVPIHTTGHIVSKQLEMVEYLGLTPPHRDLSLFWDHEAEATCATIAGEQGLLLDEAFVVIHASSPSKYKLWRAEGYGAVIDYLQNDRKMRAVLICGGNRKEIEFLERIKGLCASRPVDLGGRLSLPQLAALLSHSRLFIGIDSGPMHMAAAVKTPVIALFGPSRPWRWGPWGAGHEVVQKSWDCVPCGKEGCNGSGISKCLDELTREEVVTVLDAQLSTILP